MIVMGCNRDSYCNTIANNYASKKESINSDLTSVKSDINNICELLNSFVVPNDYVGGKVKEKLESISKNFESNSDNVTSFNSEINTFINSKIEEHHNHYQSWKLAQEELAKKENGDKNGNN